MSTILEFAYFNFRNYPIIAEFEQLYDKFKAIS